MGLKFANNATALIGSSVQPSDTTISLASGAGSKFPSLSTGDWFPVTAVKASDPSQLEIMRCTARSGDVLTVTRAQEGTIALSFDPGDVIELRITRSVMETLAQTNDVVTTSNNDNGARKVAVDVSALTANRTITMPNKNVNLGAIPWGDVTSKPETATRWPTWSEVTSKPTTFAPSAHTHPAGQITAGTFGAGNYAVTGNFNAGGNIVANGNVTAYSDARLKGDIKVIEDALDKVDLLCGVTFNRIDTGERGTGLIAQDVIKVLPEAVIVGDDEQATLSVAYGNLVGLLVEAVKQLRAELRDLKGKVEV